jgi:uncharacterized membrane protein
MELRRTRLSLYYLVGYLVPAGVSLIVAPRFTLDILGSNGDYGSVTPRALGITLFVLGVLILQIVRHRVHELYTTTLAIRVFIVAGLVGIYLDSDDPVWLALSGVVALGFVFTGSSYLLDRRDSRRSAADHSTLPPA